MIDSIYIDDTRVRLCAITAQTRAQQIDREQQAVTERRRTWMHERMASMQREKFVVGHQTRRAATKSYLIQTNAGSHDDGERARTDLSPQLSCIACEAKNDSFVHKAFTKHITKDKE